MNSNSLTAVLYGSTCAVLISLVIGTSTVLSAWLSH